MCQCKEATGRIRFNGSIRPPIEFRSPKNTTKAVVGNVGVLFYPFGNARF